MDGRTDGPTGGPEESSRDWPGPFFGSAELPEPAGRKLVNWPARFSTATAALTVLKSPLPGADLLLRWGRSPGKGGSGAVKPSTQLVDCPKEPGVGLGLKMFVEGLEPNPNGIAGTPAI